VGSAAAPVPVRAAELPAALVAPAKLRAVAIVAGLPLAAVRAALLAALVAVAALSRRAHALAPAGFPLARAVARARAAIAARLRRARVTDALATAAVPLAGIVAALHAAATTRHLHAGRADALTRARIELAPAPIVAADARLLPTVAAGARLSRARLADTADTGGSALLTRRAGALGPEARARPGGVARLHAPAGATARLPRSTLRDALHVALAVLAQGAGRAGRDSAPRRAAGGRGDAGLQPAVRAPRRADLALALARGRAPHRAAANLPHCAVRRRRPVQAPLGAPDALLRLGAREARPLALAALVGAAPRRPALAAGAHERPRLFGDAAAHRRPKGVAGGVDDALDELPVAHAAAVAGLAARRTVGAAEAVRAPLAQRAGCGGAPLTALRRARLADLHALRRAAALTGSAGVAARGLASPGDTDCAPGADLGHAPVALCVTELSGLADAAARLGTADRGVVELGAADQAQDPDEPEHEPAQGGVGSRVHRG